MGSLGPIEAWRENNDQKKNNLFNPFLKRSMHYAYDDTIFYKFNEYLKVSNLIDKLKYEGVSRAPHHKCWS